LRDGVEAARAHHAEHAAGEHYRAAVGAYAAVVFFRYELDRARVVRPVSD
jgi:hypothetical protein